MQFLDLLCDVDRLSDESEEEISKRLKDIDITFSDERGRRARKQFKEKVLIKQL